MAAPSRYEFLATFDTLHTELPTAMANDSFWTAISNTYNAVSTHGVQGKNIILKNKKKANMVITLAMANGSYNRLIRYGLRPHTDDAQPKVDAYLHYPASGGTINRPQVETPTAVSTNNVAQTFKFYVFSNEDYVYIHGIPQGNVSDAHTINLFAGTCTPFDVEDPAIANDFYGVFPHVPVGETAGSAVHAARHHRYGTGFISKSRNGDDFPIYRFVTNSNLVSPGAGGQYYLSPFYVFMYNEGVRGELTGMRTAVLKDGSAHPDGSVLEIGTEQYYVFHIPNIETGGTADHQSYTSGGWYYSAPYFFDSQIINGGQRVLLFKI